MAITTVFPIRTAENIFWSSPEGLSFIERFLSSFRRIQGIDRFVVNTDEAEIISLSRKYKMDFTNVAIPGRSDDPYTCDESRSLAETFFSSGTTSSDTLIIADHRNLLLCPEDIEKAVHVFRDASLAGVFSLTFCKDYPCQYRSFYHFLGSIVLTFADAEEMKLNEGICAEHVMVNCKKHGKLNVSYSRNVSGLRIAFESENTELTQYVARMVPFDASGLQYNDSREFFVPKSKYDIQIDFSTPLPLGIVLFLCMPSRTGEYDAVEIFTPPDAPWRLVGEGDVAVDAKTLQPLLGRQLFPDVYAYDGSLCVFSNGAFSSLNQRDPGFIILEDTCFVSDWVHYLRFVS